MAAVINNTVWYPILRYNGKTFYEIQLKMISYANICKKIKAK